MNTNTNTNNRKGQASGPESERSEWEVMAYYFESGNEYRVYASQSLGLARVIRDACKARLTEGEREAFTYVIARGKGVQ